MKTVTPRSCGLDCVRCLALFLVLACHGSLMVFPWFGWQVPLQLASCGTYGVTLFFTLSGFLIGRILIRLSDQEAGWRDWLDFMRRRWARTLPPYFLWLLVLSAVWPPRALDPGAYDRLSNALPWFATLTQNLAWPMQCDWFGVSWSLGVEEWFYLVFSAALLAGGNLLGRRKGFWLVLGVFLLLPPLLRVMLPIWNDAVQFGSGIVVMRLDAAGYGVLLAWLSLNAPAVRRHPGRCLGCGVGLLVMSFAGGLDPLWRAFGAWGSALSLAVLPLGFALCLPAAAATNSIPAWLRRPVELFCQRSYAIYLCHLSILEWANYDLRLVFGIPPTFCFMVAAGAVWAFSCLSLRYVEMPILARPPLPRSAIATAGHNPLPRGARPS